jgi:hypothetical protein
MVLNSFLKRFLPKFYEGSKRQQSSASPEFSSLTRFIYYKNHYSNGRPKPAAFLPPSGKSCISMLYIDDLQEDEIWKVGDEVGKARNKTTAARADIADTSVRLTGLSVALTPGIHRNHVDACAWPARKDEQKAIAVELCIATLQVRHI